jgi:hypothetical protein
MMEEFRGGKNWRDKSQRSGKNRSRANYSTSSKAILNIKQYQRNKHQIKATFIGKNGCKVKELIHTFSDGNPKELLIILQRQLITLGKRYYLFENGKWKLLSQVGGRTLDGRIEDIRSYIVEGETNYVTGDADAQLNRFVTLIQKVNEQYLGKNASDNQNDAMADGTLYYEEDPVLAVTDCLESKAISNYSVKILNLLRSEWLA